MKRLLVLVWPVVTCVLTQPLCAYAVISGNGSESVFSAKQKIENSVATQCCWCRFKSNGASEVASYFGKASCEDKGPSRFADCRAIGVEGNSCSFISISHHHGATQCVARPLVFSDGKQDRQIQPPPWAVATCKSSNRGKEVSSHEAKLATALSPIDREPDEGQAASGLGSSSGNGNDALPKLEMDADGHYTSYWTCGRDSTDEGKCKARYVENGQDVVTESKELGNEKTCSPSFCDKNFSDKFGSLSRVFEPSEP